MPSRILSISYRKAVRTTRDLLLRQQGYSVRSAADLENALNLYRQSTFDLAIIGQCVPLADQMTIANAIRASCPDARILVLTESDDSKPTFAHASMNGLDGPRALLQKVRTLLEPGEMPLKAAS